MNRSFVKTYHRHSLRVLSAAGAALLVSAVVNSPSAAEDAPLPTAVKRDPELEALTKLLDIAWSGDKQAPQAAKQAYESLRAQVQDRQRWHYAYGVASLKMKRYPVAVQAFQAANQESQGFHFASWKGLIWTELTLKRYDDGVAHLESLARTVSAPEFAGAEQDRDHVAVWVGQSLAALEKIVTAPKTLERLAEADGRLKELWPEDLGDAYQSGRDYADTQYAELMSDLKQASDDAKSREELARTQKQQTLQKDIADTEKQRDELKKSAEELQKQTDQKTLQIDKQLTRLERDYNFLEVRAQSIMRSMAILQSQLLQAQMRQQANSRNRTTANSPFSGSLDDPVQRIDVQLGVYQREYEATAYRANLVVQRAVQGLQLREQTLRQLQQAAGELGRQDATLGKWRDRLAHAGENLKKVKIKGTSTSVRQKRAQAKSLNTYLEFDPEWERIRLTEPPEKS